MEISTRKTSDAFVIELKGNLDKICRLDKLLDAIGQGADERAIQIDLTGVDLVSSNFINFLCAVRKVSPQLSSKIALVNPKPGILELLQLTHMSEFFPILVFPKRAFVHA